MTRINIHGIRWLGMEPTPSGDVSHMAVRIHDTEENELDTIPVPMGANAVDLLVRHRLDEDGAFQINMDAYGVTDTRDLARLLRHYASILDEGAEEEHEAERAQENGAQA